MNDPVLKQIVSVNHPVWAVYDNGDGTFHYQSVCLAGLFDEDGLSYADFMSATTDGAIENIRSSENFVMIFQGFLPSDWQTQAKNYHLKPSP